MDDVKLEGRKPYGAAAAAHGTPGDRPPAVPAVSRCRARQHHGQAVGVASVHRSPGECHSRRPDRHALSGLAPPAVLRIPLRGTRLRRAVHPGASASPAGL